MIFYHKKKLKTLKHSYLSIVRSGAFVSDKKNQTPFGFMGINKERLEMLFIASDMIGKGYGKKLLDYGIRHYFVNELCVNEQNPLARAFYEHMGFEVYKRSDLDEQGNPYPLLYMKRT